MYYLPLNTAIITTPERTMRNGNIRPATTVTLTVARETGKAFQMKLTSSRGDDFGDLIWLPKSQITVGSVAVVFHAHWVADKMKSAFPYRDDPFTHGCPSIGFRYPDAANMREVEAFAYQMLADTGSVTQEQIDAHFAPAPVAPVETVEVVEVEVVEAVEAVEVAPMLFLPTKKQTIATQKGCRQYFKAIKASARRATRAKKETSKQAKRTARAISIANTAIRRCAVKMLKLGLRAAAEAAKIAASAAKTALPTKADMLLAAGGKEYKTGDLHRIYMNDLLALYGMTYTLNNSGRLLFSYVDGEKISNTDGASIMSALSQSKVWYDYTDDTIHYRIVGSKYRSAAAMQSRIAESLESLWRIRQ